MTAISPADIKVGDRIAYTREGTVTAISPADITLEVKRNGTPGTASIRLCLEPTGWVETRLELLDRPLPEEPPAGSVVMFRPKNERHLTQTTVYQHFSDYWQSTRLGQDRYAWADVLKIHEGERLEVLVTA